MPRGRKRRDVALVYGMTEDQEGYKILRQRGARAPIEAGVLQPLREGKNIVGEVVKLTPRKNAPLFYDVDVEVSADEALAAAAEAGSAPGPGAGAGGSGRAGAGPRTADALASSGRGPGPAQVASDEYRRGWDAIWGTTGRGRTRSVAN